MSLDDMIRQTIREVLREELHDQIAPLIARATPPPPPPLRQYITAKEAAEILGVCEDSIRNWVRAGKLKKHNAGRSVRIDRHELEELVSSGLAPTNVVDIRAKIQELYRKSM